MMKRSSRGLGGALKGRIVKIVARYRRLVKRRVFLASIRPSDVFMITYPKSGTTWLGFLIASVLKKNAPEPLNIRSITRYVPDLNEVYDEDHSLGAFRALLRGYESLSDPRFFLGHPTYEPSFPKVVYLLRDPRDVVVSYWHYRRLTDTRFDASLKEFVTWCVFHRRWDEHVEGWLLDHARPNLLVVRYEEMHQDAAAVLRRILDFSGVAYTTAEVVGAVEAARFEKMRALEDQFGVDNAARAEERFMRRGRIGGWRDELDEESLRILEEQYSKVMRRVGYAPVTTVVGPRSSPRDSSVAGG